MGKILQISLLSILLAACGTPNVRNDYSFNESEGKGLIIGSITRSKSPKGYQGYSASISKVKLHYQNLFTQETNYIEIDPAGAGIFYSGDFPDEKGELFVIELPPGNYTFDKWSALQGTYTSVSSELTRPFKFRVLEENAVYIGNLNLELFFNRGILGIGVLGSTNLTIEDNRDRDIQLLKKRYPNIEITKLVYELADDKPTW